MSWARRAAAIETGLIVGGFAVLWFFLPHGLKGDDWPRLDNVGRLVREGHVGDSKFSYVQALLSAPLEWIDQQYGSLDYLIARFNILIVALGTLVAYLIVRRRVDASLFRKFVLVLLFASMLTNGLRGYGAEISTSVLVAVGIVIVVCCRRRWPGWALMVVGVVNTPAAIGGLALVALVETVRARRARMLLPAVVAVVLIGAEAWIRRGSPLDTGYGGDRGTQTILPYSGRPEFSYPFLLGVVSILFAFGRGLVFYAPGLLFWLSAGTRRLTPGGRLAGLMLAYLSGLVLVYAKWWSWYGGLSWGPRFFFFAAIPASLFLAARLDDVGRSALADAATLVVLLFSGWVSLTGGTLDLYQLYLYCSQGLEAVCWYVPDYSSLWQPILKFPPLAASTQIYVAYATVVVAYLAAPPVVSIFRALLARRHDVAWAHGWRF